MALGGHFSCSVFSPSQSFPPLAGAGALHSRFLVLNSSFSPHTVQSPHSPNPPSTATTLGGHFSCSVFSPSQSFPPLAGAGALHSRFLVLNSSLSPHTVQSPHSPNPPSMALGGHFSCSFFFSITIFSTISGCWSVTFSVSSFEFIIFPTYSPITPFTESSIDGFGWAFFFLGFR